MPKDCLDCEIVHAHLLQVACWTTAVCVPAVPLETVSFEHRLYNTVGEVFEVERSATATSEDEAVFRLDHIEQNSQRLNHRPHIKCDLGPVGLIQPVVSCGQRSYYREVAMLGGERCALLNTAIDSDDGNPQLRAKARQALSSLLDRLRSVAEEGQRQGEVRADVDSTKLATLIASTLEGSIMVSRLQKKEGPRDLAVRRLEEYLETGVRARKAKAGAAKS
jgi:hypothetical protein